MSVARYTLQHTCTCIIVIHIVLSKGYYKYYCSRCTYVYLHYGSCIRPGFFVVICADLIPPTERELLDENHLRMRRDILASILEDIHVLYPCKSSRHIHACVCQYKYVLHSVHVHSGTVRMWNFSAMFCNLGVPFCIVTDSITRLMYHLGTCLRSCNYGSDIDMYVVDLCLPSIL